MEKARVRASQAMRFIGTRQTAQFIVGMKNMMMKYNSLILSQVSSYMRGKNWRFCPLNNRYIVDDEGSVYSVRARFKHRSNKIIDRYEIELLAGTISSRGYRHYALFGNGKEKKASGHRIVLISFLGLNPVKPHGNHKNGIKTDNRLLNLEWVTDAENKAHAQKTNLLGKLNMTPMRLLDKYTKGIK